MIATDDTLLNIEIEHHEIEERKRINAQKK